MNDYAKLLLVILFWAGDYPLGKLALDKLSPLVLTAARAALAAPLLLAVARASAPLAAPPGRRDYLAFVVLGLTGLVADTTVWYLGLRHTTTLNAGIISASSPIFVALAVSALLGDRLSGRAWVGIGLSVAAVVLTVAKGSLATLLSLSMNRGDLIILLSQTAASTLPPRTSSPPARWCCSRSPSTARGRRRGGHRLAGRSCSTQRGSHWRRALLGEAVHVYHVVGAALIIAGVVLTTTR